MLLKSKHNIYMLKKLNWEAIATDERNKVIEAVKDAISTHDGYIMNFNMYSDLGLSLSIEIEENNIVGLYKALSTILKMSDFKDDHIKLKSKKECLLLLYVSFIQGKGSLKKTIPQVPG